MPLVLFYVCLVNDLRTLFSSPSSFWPPPSSPILLVPRPLPLLHRPFLGSTPFHVVPLPLISLFLVLRWRRRGCLKILPEIDYFQSGYFPHRRVFNYIIILVGTNLPSCKESDYGIYVLIKILSNWWEVPPSRLPPPLRFQFHLIPRLL